MNIPTIVDRIQLTTDAFEINGKLHTAQNVAEGREMDDWIPGDWGVAQNIWLGASRVANGDNIVYVGGGRIFRIAPEADAFQRLDEWIDAVTNWSRDENGHVHGTTASRNRQYTPLGLKGVSAR